MIFYILSLKIYTQIMDESVFITFFKQISILLYHNHFGYYWQRFCTQPTPPIILPSRVKAHE
jgi:hypothetical protein